MGFPIQAWGILPLSPINSLVKLIKGALGRKEGGARGVGIVFRFFWSDEDTCDGK